jgi:hypothetical protein
MTAPAPQFAPLGGAAGQPSDAAPADEEIPAVPARLAPAAARSGMRRTLTPGGDPPANGSPASEIHELHRASGAPARPVAASMPKIDVDPQTGPERTAPEAFALHIKAAEAAAHTESKAAAVKPLPATARRTPAAADVSESPRPKESKKADAAPQKTQAAADTARHKGAATNGQAHEERENREDRNDAPVKPSAPASFKTAVAEHADPAAPLARPAATAIDPAAAAPKTETADPRPARAPEAPSAPAPVPQESVESKSPVRAAQEISLRVGADSKVEIRVSDRAGEVHVSVRTPDEALARAMREDLGSLTGKLAQAGYETAAPSGAAGMDSHHPGENRNTGQQDTPQHGGSGNSQQQQQQRQEGEGRGRRPATFEEFSQFMSNRSTEKTEK